MEELELCRDYFLNRHERIKEIKEKEGKKVIGWICNYVPEEILYAAGMIPIRIFGGEEGISLADGYTYPNTCSYCRSCLEEALKECYSFLDGLVTFNNCDHVRRLFDVWNYYVKMPYIRLFNLPHVITDYSLDFYKQEISKFKDSLEESFKIEISDQSISHAIEIYNETRNLLHDLYQLRLSEEVPISGEDTLYVVLAAMLMPKHQFNPLLRELLRKISHKKGGQKNGKRVLISGSELDDPEYIKTIEDAGAVVVADDLCIGSRYFWNLVEEDGDPVESLARRYLTHSPCPRMLPPDNRFNFLKEMIKSFNVEGIIHEKIKFCTLYGMDIPLFDAELKELNIPVLFLEREYRGTGVGQIMTRVQAFLEMKGEGHHE